MSFYIYPHIFNKLRLPPSQELSSGASVSLPRGFFGCHPNEFNATDSRVPKSAEDAKRAPRMNENVVGLMWVWRCLFPPYFDVKDDSGHWLPDNFMANHSTVKNTTPLRLTFLDLFILLFKIMVDTVLSCVVLSEEVPRSVIAV